MPLTCYKKREQVQNGVTGHQTSPNQDLIPNLMAVSASLRNGILNQSIWNYLVSTREVICLIDPCCPLKEGDLATDNPLFAGVTSLSRPLLPIKAFPFVQLLGTPFCLLDGMLPNL